MVKGGARPRSGPAPDPTALARERDAGEWTTLPATGRPGDPPEWPLIEQEDREADLWAMLWRKPQALMWDRYGQQLEVALYVRNLTLAEVPGSPVNLGTLLRQMADSLGLTTPGMRANRWKIAPAESAKQPAAASSARSPARSRFKVVPSGDSGA